MENLYFYCHFFRASIFRLFLSQCREFVRSAWIFEVGALKLHVEVIKKKLIIIESGI